MQRQLAQTFRGFRYRDFRLVWIGAFISTTGTWMQTVAQSWVVLELTGSAFYLGVDAFLATLPMILFSLFSGVLADRIDRRKLLLVSQALQMTFAFVLAALIASGLVRVWHIFVLSFLTGSAQSLGAPAYQALLPVLVDREDMPNAIALNSMQFNLARMVGPVFAGFALAAFGSAACFALNGISFMAVIVTLLMIRTPFVPKRHDGVSILDQMREGFRFLGVRPELLHLCLLAFLTSFFAIPLITLLPVVAKQTFGLGATGYSWIMAASGAGSVVGAIVVAGSSYTRRKGRLTLEFQLATAVFLMIFAFSRLLPLSLVAIFLTSTALLGVIAMTASLIQLATTEEMRGRVMSVFMLTFRGGMPLGNLLSGWVAENVSVTVALAVNATALCIVGLGFLVPKTRVREL